MPHHRCESRARAICSRRRARDCRRRPARSGRIDGSGIGAPQAAHLRAPRGHPADRPGAPAARRHRRRDPGRPRDPRGHGLREDRRHAGHHRPVHAPPADPRCSRSSARRATSSSVPTPRRRRSWRPAWWRRGAAAGSPQYVAAGVARGADVRRLAHRRAAAQARVHRQLPVAQRPDRLPHRRRHPGRDGPARRACSGSATGAARRSRSSRRPCRRSRPRPASRRWSCRSPSSASILGLGGSTRRSRARSSRSSASIVASYVLDLAADGVTTLGTVPGGLPTLGLPDRRDHRRPTSRRCCRRSSRCSS